MSTAPITRARFLRYALCAAGCFFVDRRTLSAAPSLVMHEPLKHPDPRPGITAEHVLAADAIGNRKKVVAAYDAARAFPEVFDGIACGCGCGGTDGEHRDRKSVV